MVTEKKSTEEKVAERDQPEPKETMPEKDSSSGAESMPEEKAKAKTTPEPRHVTTVTTTTTSADDMGIVIVDDDMQIDQEKINEERRAYLEEARSQEAFD